jgi:hypothetical protein
VTIFGNRIRRAVTVTIAVAGIGALGAGAANAAPNNPVLSDKIGFSGVAVPGSAPGSFVFRSRTCRLTSDTETQVFPCQLTGQFAKSATGGISGSAMAVSQDGKITWKFTLVPTTVANEYRLRGAGSEMDAPDPGQPPPPTYPCAVMGSVKLVPMGTGFGMTGGLAVFESSTSP